MGITVAILLGQYSIIFVSILACAWRILNWVWLKPRRLERLLRQQGLKGNSYKFFFGDTKESSMMIKEAKSKPISFSHDILSRVSPFLHQTVQNYGKGSFIWFGPIPRVNIMETEQIREVFSKFSDFQKPATNPLVRKLAPGLGNSEGQKWTKHRKIINPAFHLEKLKRMLPAFYQSCSEMISEWEKLVALEGSCELDVWPFLVNLTSDVISRTAFGSNYEEGRRIFELQNELASLTKQLTQSVYFPGKRFLPTKINKKIEKIDKEIEASLKIIINRREKAIKEDHGLASDDLLGILMESNFREIQENGNNKKFGMSIKDVIEECKLFYFAGKETTSTLLAWTMVLLSKHMDWQIRAREEVLQLFGNNKPDFDGLNHLKMANMILYEVLRLYPPGDTLLRTVTKEMKLGNLTLPAGVQLSLPMIFMHHDPQLWGEDVTEFKPERFSEGVSKATKNKLSFFPFGWGPRICIGQNFALLEAKMALALVLQNFWFELSSTYAHAPFPVTTIQPQYGAHLILHKL
ncbi:Cytochrome P450 [Melia azedarach]|uniref:Cytochrome P450 n=1 Tax=Melia azedarach TaxID=155640 RepID=A0ACC1YRV6_MELAZ|nr:Cytochrome P450 [Melia azedarach]